MTTRPNCRPTNRPPLHSRSAQLDFIYHQTRALTSTEFFTAATIGLSTTPCKLGAFSRTALAFCSFFPGFDGITGATQIAVNAEPSPGPTGPFIHIQSDFHPIVRQTPDSKLRHIPEHSNHPRSAEKGSTSLGPTTNEQPEHDTACIIGTFSL
jgi:hypothetical protein